MGLQSLRQFISSTLNSLQEKLDGGEEKMKVARKLARKLEQKTAEVREGIESLEQELSDLPIDDEALGEQKTAELREGMVENMRITTSLEQGELSDLGIHDEADEALGRKREEEAKKRASLLMRDLTRDESSLVHRAMHGPSDEFLAKSETDTVQRQSIQTLEPGQWLNDEVIHYFYLMLARRDEEMCRNDPSRKRSHFFKSFFITKILNEGHRNPAIEGKYEYKNVKRWSKKVPGKDIFKLDKIIFPINQGQMHWMCGVIHMQKKRIQIYDSMGSGGSNYLQCLFQYVQDEHKDKKKCPLPDIDEWELVGTTSDTPRQRNGFDCGVFTCMFADFVSKDCPLVFSQEHITQCRERIVLAIMNGKAIL